MSEQRQAGNPAQKVAETAGAVKGAVKAGKMAAGASKGSALGPYGMAAALVWTNRKLIGKIIAAAVLLLMIPILFVIMLPGIIFGGLTEGFTGDNSEIPILNSETVINENLNDISIVINGVLHRGIDDVLLRIEDDFARRSADNMEIINPFEDGVMYNINLYISQYCAYKNEDFANISIDDLGNILEREVDNLYSYKHIIEERDDIEVNPETGEETIIKEVWVVYTIIYNGEHYFADSIFGLTDEQKQLSQDYAENLSLMMGDGLFQIIGGENVIPALGDIRFANGSTEVVYFNQLDASYANAAYGTDNIGGYGCGPTAMSIIISSLTDTIIDPIRMSKWAYENGYWISGGGSYHSLIPGAATAFGIPVEGCTVSEPQRVVDALAQGKLVVAIMGPGHFTTAGHFIVLRGVTSSGKILVADPASYNKSNQEWDLSIILNEASKRAGAGGPFWILG